MAFKIITDEVSVESFHAGIFIFGADLLSPVVFHSQEPPQYLAETCKEQKKIPSQWMSYAGPGGIAQYSLRKGTANVVARFNVHFRLPTLDEMLGDFREFGEQVMGPDVEEIPPEEREKYKHNGSFPCWDKQWYYAGPPRISKATFVTRVFPGEFPQNVSDFVREVDEESGDSEMTTRQCYHFMHARDGRIQCASLGKAEDFNPSQLKDYGHVEITGRKMLYFPPGSSEGTDFSACLKNF